jgi:hypothetical protein
VFRWSTILLALLLSAHVLWQGFIAQTIPAESAVIRFLLAVPVAAILLGLVRAATAKGQAPQQPPVP